MLKRPTIGLGAVLLAIALATAGGMPAVAVGADQGTIGTCTFVSDPSPTNHTSCPGADLRPSVGFIPGLNLDFADLEGANLAGSPLLIASSSSQSLRLAGADLTDVNFRGGMDLSGGSLKGAVLVNTRMEGMSLAGLDLTGTVFQGTTSLIGSDLSGTNLTNVKLGSTPVGSAKFAGALVKGAQLPVTMWGSSWPGVDFSTSAGLLPGTGFTGSNLTGAKFDNLAFDGITFNGCDLTGASFVGATFAPGSSVFFGGATGTRSDFHGVDFSPAGALNMSGMNLTFANLAGSTFPVWTGMDYSDANLEGAKLFHGGGGIKFHRANMRGVVALYDADPASPLSFQGSEFDGADLTGANLDNTYASGATFRGTNLTGASLNNRSLDGTVFSDANLTGAKIQSTGYVGLNGMLIVRSNLTNTQFPPAKNGTPDRWLRAVHIEDSILTGSSYGYRNVVTTAPSMVPAPASFPLPSVFLNPDGQLPYGDAPQWNSNYWQGLTNTCDHYSGDIFPAGMTTVSCTYTYIADHSSTSTFTVTVNVAPEITGTVPGGIVGTPFSAALNVSGFPAPVVSVASGSLPTGLALSASGVLSGTPAAGTSGHYAALVAVTNSSGTTTLPVSFWVIDPAVTAQHAAQPMVGEKVTAIGNSFTPGGNVEVWIHSSPKLLGTVKADQAGTVYFDTSELDAGVHHFVLKDLATGTEAASASFTISAPAAAATSAALAFTGTETGGAGVLAVLMILTGVAIAISRRTQRRGASA